MSASPHVVMGSRDGQRMGDWKMVDTMINDGLWDAYNHYHMGTTAENVAKKYGISREEQDAFAAASQQKAEAAQRPAASRTRSSLWRSSAARAGWCSTPTNSSSTARRPNRSPASSPRSKGRVGDGRQRLGINDGAAAVLMMSASKAKALGLQPLARIAAYASAGLEPTIMGMGRCPPSKLCLHKAGWTADELDLMGDQRGLRGAGLRRRNKEMGWDTSKINVNGGAIAIGHPIGASGCRVLVTLIHEMIRRDARRGLASLCIGGGMGVALAIER